MSDSHSNAEQHTASDSRPGYGLPNKAEPLPRQWQLPLQTPVQRSQAGVQHFYRGSAGADNWQPAGPSRRMERAILSGLWLLVMLAVITIVLRVMDRDAPSAIQGGPARSQASAGASNAMRSGALAVGTSKDDDPFDEPLPTSLAELPPVRPVAPIPAPAPAPAAVAEKVPPRPVSTLTAASALTIDRPAAAMPEPSTGRASAAPVCAEALRAMQLCPDMR